MKSILGGIIWVFLIGIFVSLVNFYGQVGIFNTPDESGNYIVTKKYSESSIMYLTWEYLDIDSWNNIHPRWFITTDWRAVPFGFLWLPLIYGPLFSYFWEALSYINIVFIFIFWVFLWRLARLYWIIKNNSISTFIIWFVWCLPLLYFFNFSYQNVVPYITFLIITIYYIEAYNKLRKVEYLYLFALFAVLAIWIRYEQVIFISLFFLVNIVSESKIYSQERKIILHIILMWLVWVSLFLIPLLILNKDLYGNYLTYGYSLFTETYFAGERTGNIVKSIINIFFPSQEVDIGLLLINIKNNLILISPVVIILWIIYYIRSGITKKSILYTLLLIYLILYTGMSPTYGSGWEEITLHNSILRYWLLLYIVWVLWLLWFIQITRGYTRIFILFAILINLGTFFNDINKSISNIQNWIKLQEKISKFSPDYIVDPLSDKHLFQRFNMITWQHWVDYDEHFEGSKEKLAASIIRILQDNKRVLALESSELSKEYHFVELEKYWIRFQKLDWKIYEILLKEQ